MIKKGRPKGSTNKMGASVKETFEKAFHLLQQNDRVKLAKWGEENPTDFYKLAAKLIPAEINAKVESRIERIEVVRTANPFDSVQESAEAAVH